MASLDASLKDRVLGYMEKVLDEWQIPTLYVTHDLAEVKRVAEWVVILETGKVRFAGALAESIGK
jgi:molybdate transport system ATP-binding protein